MPRRSDGPHRSVASRRRRHFSLLLTFVLVVAGGLFTATAATASPQGDLASKNAQARKLEAQIEADQSRAEMLDEQYLEAQQAVADAQQKIDAAEAGIAKAQKDTAGLRDRLAGRAALLYIGAGNDDPFNIDATDVRELGTRAKYGEAAADQDSQLLDRLRLAQEQLAIQRKDLKKIQSDARQRQDAANHALSELKQATAQAQNALSSVKGDIRGLVAKIQAEKAAADAAHARAAYAAMRARAAAEAASLPASTASSSSSSGSGSSSGTSAPSDNISAPPINAPAASPGAAAAVSYAYAQVGKPYRYAGTGPDAFDCSGLTMMAWAQAGVSMPHSSYAQATMFPRVSDSALQPGDLAIYYSDHHHVGIYVGGGMTISATHTGDFVRLQPVFRSGYQFSVRP